MGGRRILSDAQIEEMCALREEGWSLPRIAQHFTDAGTPITANAIDRHCMIHGADAPPHRRPPSIQLSAPYTRGEHVVRPFAEQEDKQLLELRGQGLRISEISRRTGRRPNSIRARLLTLARRDARAEDATEMGIAAE